MIRWTVQALSDLENIHQHIAEDDPEAASSTVRAILQSLSTVETFPKAGRTGTRFPGTRELVVYPYLVVYINAIEVVTIIHGARRHT